jgi:glycosyltransferase involved in cell wall biosynthesis
MTRLLAIIEATTITGPARNLLEFARYSHSEDVETVVATFVRSQSENLFTRTASHQGTRVEVIPESGPWDPSVLQRLNGLVDRVQPDVIQTHAVKSHFLIRRSGIPNRKPWIAFHHGYTWPDLKARLYNKLDRWSLRAPQRILTVSQPFRDELIAIGIAPDRIEVIHNAIASDWAQPNPGAATALRAEFGIPPDRSIILIVGRFSREKDHLTLLDAIHQLPSDTSPHLLLVGDGPERPRIEAKIRALDMSNRVTLAGQRDSAQPFYGLASIAVLSSLSEGSPNALLEAMSAGVPTVATNVGGVPEIAEAGQSALLVRPSNIPEMRDAIHRLLTDAALARRLAARSRQLIAERHTPQARVTRLAGIYHRAAGRPAGARAAGGNDA